MLRVGVVMVLVAILVAGCSSPPAASDPDEEILQLRQSIVSLEADVAALAQGDAPPEPSTNATVRVYCFCYAFSAVIDNGEDVWWLRGFNGDLQGNASWDFVWEGAAPLNVTTRDLNMTFIVPGELVAVKVGVGSSPSTCSSAQGAVSVAIKRNDRPVAIMSDSSGCPTVRLQG
ncbi:MAG: hypothetical protein ACYC2H_07235 [Thermoplasmatota archaeon]